MNEEITSVIDAAEILGMQKQTLFKWLKRLNIDTIKEKSTAHRGQTISYISNLDLELIQRSIEKREIESSTNKTTRNTNVEFGVFYLIQLEPEIDPGRFKLGFASNMNERLRDHRCSAPYAEIIETWECHVLWEKTAIDSVTQNCEKIHTEVFRSENIEEIKERCEAFFALMPSLENLLR